MIHIKIHDCLSLDFDLLPESQCCKLASPSASAYLQSHLIYTVKSKLKYPILNLSGKIN